VEFRADVESRGGAAAHEHRLARAVLDLRTGRRASLSALFGPREGARLAAEGRRRLAASLDSVRALAGGEPRDVARPALRALRTVRFDSASFGLASVGRAPAVAFVAVGADAEGRAVSLVLPPVPAPTPAWWARDVAPSLPAWDADSAEARFAVGPGHELVARRDPRGGRHGRLALRAAGARAAHPLGEVAGPVHQVLPLPAWRAAAGDSARRALRRAFDESAFYGDATTSVAWRPGAPR
jgi:hypothetical protein